MLQQGPWDSDALLQGFQLSKVGGELEGSVPLFCGCCPDTTEAALEAWGKETPWEIRLHLLPSVLSPSESSAASSVEPFLECSVRVRPSASLPVISCILELLLQPHAVIMLVVFFFSF